MKTFRTFQRQNRLILLIVGFLLLCLVGLLDYFTGTEISFSLFYVFPIALITWVSDWKIGMASAAAGAVLWFIAEDLAGAVYSHPGILYWNAGVRFSVFLLVPLSVILGKGLERQTAHARTDFITRAFNYRYIYELLQLEIDRAARYGHPFTLAYLDIDDFKSVNDRFGHSVGDQSLRLIADNLKSSLRKTDIIARAGGDEFILLLPETDSNAAKIVVSKALESLFTEEQKDSWSVTISSGVVTFMHPPQSADLALDLADKVMYEAKSHGKNNVIYSIRAIE